MREILRPALVLFVLFTLLTGVAYPVAVTGAAKVLFPREAGGSLVVRQGTAVGSALIGQPFDDPRYFFGRPSATVPFPYNATASTGSNMGPTNPALASAVAARVTGLRELDPAGSGDPVPVDLVTASGSGLDPHVSPAAVRHQIRRVARARGIGEERVRGLVEGHVEGRWLGLFGEPRVNVLLLNLALDDLERAGS